MTQGRPAWALALLLLSSASPADGARGPAEVVERFVAAFDRQDLPAFVGLAHPEIEWLSVAGSETVLETKGRDALANEMAAYFASCPGCRASVAVSSVNGPWVAGVETVTWESGGGARSQASTSVYEIADGRVRRVWYWPAVAPAP